MKTVIFYIYIGVLNFCWVLSFTISLAGGHGFNLNNKSNLFLFGASIICIVNSVLLLFYERKRKLAYKAFTLLFLFCILVICGYALYNLLIIGPGTYLVNIPFYFILLFIAFYTTKFLFAILIDIKASSTRRSL